MAGFVNFIKYLKFFWFFNCEINKNIKESSEKKVEFYY